MIDHTRGYEIIDYREDMRVRFDHSRPNSTHSHIPSLDERSPEADHLTGTKHMMKNTTNASPPRRIMIRPATDSLIHEPPAHRTPPADRVKALFTIFTCRPDIRPEHT
jgi:hypothetical protein